MIELSPSAKVILDRLDREGIDQLWVTYTDYLGRSGSKTLPRESFRGAFTSGVVFALANLNMDSSDHQAAGATMLADSGDFLAVPDPRSYQPLPRFPGTARAHVWMRTTTGEPWDGCPRTALDRMVERLADVGYSVQTALEPEFYLLHRGEDGELRPINRTTMFSQDGLAKANDVVRDILHELAGMGVRVPQLGKEYGRGQYEMSLHHGPPVEAVDRYLALRGAVTDIAHAHGMVATFMPKPYREWPGNSNHIHLSVWDAAGAIDLTPSAADETSLSEVGRWFMGGILAHIDALTAIGSPTVNSYKRLQPGSWAPANAYWGYGNRSGVLRVPGVGSRRHIEFRSPDNTAQPYLILAALLGAGLDGIERQLDPGPPFEGDVGRLRPDQAGDPRLRELPRTLSEALAALETDDVVRQAIGDEILRHVLAVRRSDLAAYEVEVHQWERDLYLEQS